MRLARRADDGAVSNVPPNAETGPSSHARFLLPPALLAALRERRASRSASAIRGTTPQPLHTLDLARGSTTLDVRAAAVAFVDGMDALQREVEAAEDAFLLDPGMGPMTYLTSDGRVLLDHRTWDGDDLRRATLDEAIASLVVGAKKTGIVALLDLIPTRPVDAETCARCEGERWDTLLRAHGHEVVCTVCRGRGWVPIATPCTDAPAG